MASYLILGAGKFGRLALNRLARQDAAASFVVVDRDPAALTMTLDGVPGWTRVAVRGRRLSGAAFKRRRPVGLDHPHGAGARGLSLAPGGSPGGVGLAAGGGAGGLAGLIPGARRGPHGELYLSRARHLCPDDCAEPEVCPVTGESRDLPLHQELASLHLAGYEIRVIASRQLAPGVGGYSPRRLLDLARDMGALKGNVLIATACRCHGVIHGLAQWSGEERV